MMGELKTSDVVDFAATIFVRESPDMGATRLDFLIDARATGADHWRLSEARPAAAGALLYRRACPAGCTKAAAPVAAHPAVSTARAEDLQQN